jgi:[ribosomal protein S5]-alanine N-acetyltransferase
MQLEILETKRLYLKKIPAEVYTSMFENYSEAEIKKLFGLTSDEEFIKEKKKSQGGYTTYDRTVLSFLLVSKDTNETIGKSGYHNWYKDHRKAEIGYVLHKEENKRKGYMSEALKAILDYGFSTMNLNRIEACISPANIASLNLIKRYGFTREGLLRQHYIREGEIQDSYIFSLLKEEYEV